MAGKNSKWLIWNGILLLVTAEVVLLWVGKGGEADRDEVRTLPSQLPMTQVAEQRPQSVTVPPPPVRKQTTSPVGANASTEADPFSVDALRQRVQPAGAVPQEALLRFKTPQAYANFLRSVVGGGLVIKDKLDDLLTARVGFESVEKLRSALQNAGAEVEVGANYMVGLPRVPPREESGPGGDAPFGDTVLASIGIGAGVDRSQWGAGVTVAVVDSGVGEHPTFRADQVTHVDLVNDGKVFEGHGTAIASLIAGSMVGAQGVAPGAKILDVRVANSNGESDSFLLARGITTAANRGARVINVSMGSYGDASVVQDAVQKAQQRGITVVAAAGNEQAGVMAWPAAYSGVVSVTGVDAKGQLAYFSNTGSPTLAAPAVGIPSAYLQNNKAFLAIGNGTSQSAALVSGVAAVIAGQGGNVVLTLNRSAQALSLPRNAVGAGMLRLPTR